jgi:hypothetical protein
LIKINLYKGAASAYVQRKPKGRGFSRKLKFVFGGLAVVVVLGGTGYLIIQKMGKTPKPPKPKLNIVKTELPSKYLGVVEETVQKTEPRQVPVNRLGRFTIGYDEMTNIEKILYEFDFLSRAFHAMNQYSESGIEFNTFRLENFGKFYVLGLAADKMEFERFIKRLSQSPEADDVKVISSKKDLAAKNKVKFVLEGRLAFGLDFTHLNKGNLERIPGHSQYVTILRGFRDEGIQSGIKWTTMNPAGQEPFGNYIRHKLDISGNTTYNNWGAFLVALSKTNPCISFYKWEAEAVDKNRIKIQATTYFYTKPD